MKKLSAVLIGVTLLFIAVAGGFSVVSLYKMKNRIGDLQYQIEELEGKHKVSNFIGEFSSKILDALGSSSSTTFSLTVRADKTYTFKRSGVTGNDRTGTWKSKNTVGEVSLLCISDGVDDGTAEGTLRPFFLLTMLDDGSLMAESSIALGTTSSETAFGNIGGRLITCVIFEKNNP